MFHKIKRRFYNVLLYIMYNIEYTDTQKYMYIYKQLEPVIIINSKWKKILTLLFNFIC